MKTLTQHIEPITQPISERTSQYWQRELIRGQWYKDNQCDVKLMLETIETNKLEARAFLQGEKQA